MSVKEHTPVLLELMTYRLSHHTTRYTFNDTCCQCLRTRLLLATCCFRCL